MKTPYIEEDINVMDTIKTCLETKVRPLGCTLTYGGNTTVINYTHLFQYTKLNSNSYTLVLDLNNTK